MQDRGCPYIPVMELELALEQWWDLELELELVLELEHR